MNKPPTTEEKLSMDNWKKEFSKRFFNPQIPNPSAIINYIDSLLSLQATQERDRVIEEVKSEIWMDYTIIIQSSPHNIEVCGFCSNTGRIKNPDANGKPCICPNGYQLKEEK